MINELLAVFLPGRGKEDLPNLTTREAQILRLLINQGADMYGLEIVKASDGEISRGSIYPTLNRMEDKGFLESRQEEKTPEEIGLPRRMYRPSAAGRRVYEAMEMSAGLLAAAMEGA